jgi:hypothetical protein
MPQSRIVRFVGALAILIAVAAVWRSSGAFFQWASAPSTEHADSQHE